MAYYYITSNYDVYKTAGKRKVKKIISKDFVKKVITEFDNGVINKLPKFIIPLIRCTFPALITSDIIAVQPMSAPVGLKSALKYKCG